MPTGVYDHYKLRKPREKRTCAAPDCGNTFECKVDSKQRYCSRGCTKRGKTISIEHRRRFNFRGRKHSNETIEKKRKPREIRICENPGCSRTFECKVGSSQGYCSKKCSSRMNSPFQKGKAGIKWSSKRKKNFSQSRSGSKNPQWKGGKEGYICEFCGGKFWSYHNSQKTRLCSMQCYAQYLKNPRNNSMYSKHHTLEAKKKSREAHLGENSSRWILREIRSCIYPGCEETFECKVNSRRRYCSISCADNDRWQDKEYKEKTLRAIFKGQGIKPNKSEKLLNKLLQQLIPKEYALNVNAEIMTLGGKIPDFVNVNGQKKIIEMNGDYWHGEEITGRTKEEEEQQRINHFAQHDYQALVIWEHELEDIDTLKIKLIEFNEV